MIMKNDEKLAASLDKRLNHKKIVHNYNKSVKKMKLEDAKLDNRLSKEQPHLTMSKILILFILINCSVIELIILIYMFVTKNTTAITTFAVTVIGQSISFAIYATKAYIETKTEKALDFEKEKFEFDKIKSAVMSDTSDELDDTTGEDETSEDDTFYE